MKTQKIEQFLAARAKSPTPHIEADPFLPTRVRALVNNSLQIIFPNWRISVLVGAAALLIGVFIGNNFDDQATQSYGSQNYASVYDLNGALYQESLSDDFKAILATLDKGAQK